MNIPTPRPAQAGAVVPHRMAPRTRPPYIPAPPKDRKTFAKIRWRVIGAILRAADLDHSARVVGAIIVDRIGHRAGYIWARAATLATEAGVSAATLHRATRALEAGGYIARRAGHGIGHASEYWIDWQRWARPKPPPPPNDLDRIDLDDETF